jgi:hypothetical protein
MGTYGSLIGTPLVVVVDAIDNATCSTAFKLGDFDVD